MTLMALNYEGDGLQPNFSKENCQEGGVFRPRITHDLDRGRADFVWDQAQRTGRWLILFSQLVAGHCGTVPTREVGFYSTTPNDGT